MTSRLKAKIAHILPKCKGLWKDLLEASEEISLFKGQTLVDHSEICTSIYVVVQGSFECSLKVTDTLGHTVWFFVDDFFDVAVALDSYHNNEMTRYKITALENSTVYRIEKSSLEAWTKQFETFNEFYSERILRDYLDYSNIRNNMVALGAMEFLLYLQLNYPKLLNRIPANRISSFMGITPEWYSKLRKRGNPQQ